VSQKRRSAKSRNARDGYCCPECSGTEVNKYGRCPRHKVYPVKISRLLEKAAIRERHKAEAAAGSTKRRKKAPKRARRRTPAKVRAKRRWQANHQAYLETDDWARRRQKIVIRDLGRCVGCGENGRDVHHIHYRTLGHETGDELVLLCRECHSKEHRVSRLSQREAHWAGVISAQQRSRTRGAVRLVRVGAGSSTKLGAQVEAPAYQGEPEHYLQDQPTATDGPLNEAVAHQARGKGEPTHGDAGLLDAACRQSPSRVVIRRRSRSGLATETRTTLS